MEAFHIKLLWFYFWGTIGGIISYFYSIHSSKEGKKKFNLSGFLFVVISTPIAMYLVTGFCDYFFDTTKHGYIYFLSGFFSNMTLQFINENKGKILEALVKKGFDKAGIEINLKDDNKKDYKNE